MKQTLALIRPRLLTIKNRIREKNGNLRIAAFGAVGLLFWGGVFAVTYRVLSYFKSIEGLGDILAQKLLSMVLITFFSLLVFSAILTSLSKLYLSRDLNLVHSLPVACINTWYFVGGKDEPEGRSGFAHLFEHLMFMGTERVPGSDFDNIMEAGGGWNNASTGWDRTNYFSFGPSNLLPTLMLSCRFSCYVFNGEC